MLDMFLDLFKKFIQVYVSSMDVISVFLSLNIYVEIAF